MKDAFLDCSEERPTHKYSLNSLKMKADFSKMVRTNLASERSFDLKLVGGQLPFAPPGPIGKKMRGRKKVVEAREKAQDEKIEEPIVATALAQEMKVEDSGQAHEKFDFVPHLSGKFEFILNLEDREDWGKVFVYKMLEAGIDLRTMDPRYVVVTDKRGRSTSRKREEMREMMEVARSYPVKVLYNPPDMLQASKWSQGERIDWEFQNLLMYFIKASITGPGAVTMDEIKYRHHRCVFERYQLYVGEGDFWNLDNPLNEEEFFHKFPEMAPMVSLAVKVGPRLRDIFRGKEEILNMLFGG